MGRPTNPIVRTLPRATVVASYRDVVACRRGAIYGIEKRPSDVELGDVWQDNLSYSCTYFELEDAFLRDDHIGVCEEHGRELELSW